VTTSYLHGGEPGSVAKTRTTSRGRTRRSQGDTRDITNLRRREARRRARRRVGSPDNAWPRPQRPGVLGRAGRAEPVLGHRRRLPVRRSLPPARQLERRAVLFYATDDDVARDDDRAADPCRRLRPAERGRRRRPWTDRGARRRPRPFGLNGELLDLDQARRRRGRATRMSRGPGPAPAECAAGGSWPPTPAAASCGQSLHRGRLPGR
jgi:hypothetical protein